MLTQRTNVLLSPAEHMALTALSRTHGKTMGELIRHAVRQTYKISTQAPDLSATLARIRQLTKKVNTKNLDYRALVTAGRKYD